MMTHVFGAVPHWIWVLFVFAFGASVGSFLNVVIYRLPHGLKIWNPRRSFCPVCKTPIRWYDNIPIVSFILLKGRCRACGEPISLRYPLVELLTALLFVAAFYRFGFRFETVYYWVFLAVLVALTFIDINHFLLPNALTYPAAGFAIALSWAVDGVGFWSSATGAAAGWLIIAGINLVYFLLTRRIGMGMGDAGLMAMIGGFLGFGSLFFVLLAASIQGLVVGVVLWRMGTLPTYDELDKFDPLSTESQTSNAEPEEPAESNADKTSKPDSENSDSKAKYVLPFGPFLALAAVEFLFFAPEIHQLTRWFASAVFRLIFPV